MESEDLLLQICLRLDDDSIFSLSCVNQNLLRMNRFRSNNYFWYLRVAYFLNHKLKQRQDVSWKQAYYCLLDERRDNELVLSLELEMNEDRSSDILRLAVLFGYSSLVKEFLLHPSLDPSAGNNHAINTACKNGQVEIVKLLLQDSRIDPSQALLDTVGRKDVILVPEEARRYLFKIAFSRTSQTEIVSLLLEDPRVDPRRYESRVMTLLVTNNSAEVLRLILEDRRINPACDNNYALFYSARNGYTEMTKLLLEDGRANPTVNDNCILRTAYERGHREVVDLLLQDRRIDLLVRLI